MAFFEIGLFNSIIVWKTHFEENIRPIEKEVPLIQCFGLFITWLYLAIFSLKTDALCIQIIPRRIEQAGWLLFVLLKEYLIQTYQARHDPDLVTCKYHLLWLMIKPVWNMYKLLHVNCY